MGDDIFLKKIRDVYKLCEKYHSPRFSGFLDEAEQALVKEEFFSEYMLFGGYDGAERCMLGVFPEWMEADTREFPIKVLKFRKKYPKELTHRNYLGTVLSLGIERNKIGDILVGENEAYVFTAANIADFVKDGITKVAGCGVDISICGFDEISVPERRFEIIETVAASLRLDAVVAAMLNVSRGIAKEAVMSAKVAVNHTERQQPDFMLDAGDLLSVRGFGRAELIDTGRKTGSGRVHITLKKYI